MEQTGAVEAPPQILNRRDCLECFKPSGHKDKTNDTLVIGAPHPGMDLRQSLKHFHSSRTSAILSDDDKDGADTSRTPSCGNKSIHRGNQSGSSCSLMSFSDDDKDCGKGTDAFHYSGRTPQRRRSLNTSDVFCNSQLTSFRIARRGFIKSAEELMPHTTLKDNCQRRSSVDVSSSIHGKCGNFNPEATRLSSLGGDTEDHKTDFEVNKIPEGSNKVTASAGSEEFKDKNIGDCMDCSSAVRNGAAVVLVEDQELNKSENAADDWKLKVQRRFAMFRFKCGNFVNSLPVQAFMIVILFSNAIIMGAMTFEVPPSVAIALDITDTTMLGLFTFEIGLHAIYLGLRNFFKDSWLTFDAIVITLSWSFLGSNVAILRSFRVFRVFSIVSRWESLRTLFEAIGATIPRMASIWFSLLLFFYAFCVLFTNIWSSLYEDGYLDQDYFGNLGQSFVTLFQVMTLDSWAEVSRQVMVYDPWSFIGFLVFILFTAFFIANLVVAVICESLIQMSRSSNSGEGRSLSDDAEDASPGSLEKAKFEILVLQILEHQSGEMAMMRQQFQDQAVKMIAALQDIQEELDMLKQRMAPMQSAECSLPATQLHSSASAISTFAFPVDDASPKEHNAVIADGAGPMPVNSKIMSEESETHLEYMSSPRE